MPEGIIRDPKQNPREGKYGILYSANYQRYFAYDKKNKKNEKRWWVAGLRVHFDFIEDLSPTINYDGIQITEKVDDGVSLLTNDSTAHPVYKKIFDKINNDAKIFNGVPSDLEEG